LGLKPKGAGKRPLEIKRPLRLKAFDCQFFCFIILLFRLRIIATFSRGKKNPGKVALGKEVGEIWRSLN
jgi:hypothetical protein